MHTLKNVTLTPEYVTGMAPGSTLKGKNDLKKDEISPNAILSSF
jgi:hypothetical protein